MTRISKDRPGTEGLHFRQVLTPDGWKRDVSVTLGTDGTIVALGEDTNPNRYKVYDNPVVPGITDLHSHAFQYAMAGLSEVRRNPVDSFWSWRDMMYFFALQISPEDMKAIAARLYLALLKGGYTGIVEFHYVHNDRDGRSYARPEELSLAIMEAAAETGLGLTHLPVFYAHSGFGGGTPTEGQRRFILDRDAYFRLVENLKAPAAAGGHRLGIAPHSLRAATEEEVADLLAFREAHLGNCPVHIHVAEQVREIEESIAFNGKRPVDALFDMAPVDERWCLIHATHLSDSEVSRIATSGATVGLCPMTEANLGDGIFRAVDFLDAGGHVGIGSDSNIATSAASELSMLEYSQRLLHRKRNILSTPDLPNVGASLWNRVALGGARAAGDVPGAIAVGGAASFVELVASEPGAEAAAQGDAILDYHVFAGRGLSVGDVWVRGRRVVEQGVHTAEERILADYARSMARLSAELRARG